MPIITLKWATIAAINDNDSSIYSGSNNGSDIGSYNGTRSELEAEVDRIVVECLEID
jgi:hypothetical protein